MGPNGHGLCHVNQHSSIRVRSLSVSQHFIMEMELVTGITGVNGKCRQQNKAMQLRQSMNISSCAQAEGATMGVRSIHTFSLVEFIHVILIVVLVSLAAAHSITEQTTQTSYPVEKKLILVLVDGFRWDYDQLPGLTGFPRLYRRGVRVEYLRSEMPANSWPNHYSTATGLHVETHGIVNNDMYDPDTGTEFHWLGEHYTKSHWWNGGEPIWITAVKQGKRSHMFYWIGCDIEIRGMRPTYCQPYPETLGPHKTEFKAKINQAVDLLVGNETDLVGLYFDQVDVMGHEFGASTPEVQQVIKDTDEVLNYLMDQIDGSGLKDTTNVMVYSDHGMADMDESKTIRLKDYISQGEWAQKIERSFRQCAEIGIWPKSGETQNVYNLLKDKHPHMKVFLKEELNTFSDAWNFKHNSRTPPISLLADTHWCILKPEDEFEPGGIHGYDNNDEKMRGVFMAFGPDFRKKHRHYWIPNVDLYQMMCHVLGLDPAPNNGTWSHVQSMMTSSTFFETLSAGCGVDLYRYLVSVMVTIFIGVQIHRLTMQ